jgi:hypothetical protein
MRLCKRLVPLVLVATAAGLISQPLQAQQTKKTAGSSPASDKLVVRVYNVADLILTAPNYPFSGTLHDPGGMFPQYGGSANLFEAEGGAAGGGMMMRSMSGAGDTEWAMASGMSRGGTVLGGTSGGMMARSSGRSAPRSRPVTATGARFDLETLRVVLIETVEPNSWTDVGGAGNCKVLGTLLVITQTGAVHERVAEFLDELRREGGSPRSVTVRAHWLFLDAKQLGQLTRADENRVAPAALQAVHRAVLEQLAAEPKNYSGRVTCFEGQTVHIVSGRSRSAVTSLQPVVAAGAVAYDPQVSTVHDGAVLQVTPTLSGRANSAIIDIQSVVTRWDKPGEPVEITGQANPQEGAQGPVGVAAHVAGRIDRMNYLSQRLATTLRVPLDQPMLVGGMTFEPGRDDGDSPQLYLIVEVTVAE